MELRSTLGKGFTESDEMDRTAVLSALGVVLIIIALASTPHLERIREGWVVDATSSFVNKGKEGIRAVIKPPETRVFEYGGKSIIVLENLSDESVLLGEREFSNAVASQDRLLLYASRNGAAVIASSYFNEAEISMLSADTRIVGLLKNVQTPGITNISYIEVWDPTNARAEQVWVDGGKVQLLIPHKMDWENFTEAKSSSEFTRVIENSRKLSNKTLLLYHPSKSSMNVIIPVNFTDDEVAMLAKNSAVKTALEYMEVEAGRVLKLDETKEFEGVELERLPYEPNTKIYVSFEITGGFGFLSEEFLVYLAIFVVLLVILYVLYTILVA